jgi:hypothetical protein
MPAGPSFWDRGILTVIGLDKVAWISDTVPNVGLNVAFMIFATLALAFNIFIRWAHTSLVFLALDIYQPRSLRNHQFTKL